MSYFVHIMAKELNVVDATQNATPKSAAFMQRVLGKQIEENLKYSWPRTKCRIKNHGLCMDFFAL